MDHYRSLLDHLVVHKPLVGNHCLKYMLIQAYKILLDKFPVQCRSLLRKLKHGNLDMIKAANLLRNNGAMSDDIILMADEMYL